MCDCQDNGNNDNPCYNPHHRVDASSGEIVCTQCGVVVEAHLMESGLERYTEASGPRACMPESWLLPQAPATFEVPGRRRTLSLPDPHATLRKLFKQMDSMGHAFLTDVCDTAKMLCRDLIMHRTGCRTHDTPSLVATAFYLATKMHGGGVGRTKKEIATMFAGYGVLEHHVSAMSKVFVNALRNEAYGAKLSGPLLAEDLINRCVESFEMSARERQDAKKRAHQLMEAIPAHRMEGRAPKCVCSGVVACAIEDLNIPLKKKTMAAWCNVSATTLVNMTKHVRAWTECRDVEK